MWNAIAMTPMKPMLGTPLRHKFGRLLPLLVLVIAGPIFADTIVPTEDVVNGVVVRQGPSAQTASIGRLAVGSEATIIGSVPGWHHVRISSGLTGFVSKRWTRVVATPDTPENITFRVDVIDVGTGLGILVRGPDFTLIYDGGSNDDLALGASNRMLAYLRAVAPTLTTIDHVILSHPHRDHVELLPDLFANYQVREVWDSGRSNDICGYRAFLTAVRNEPGVRYHNALQDHGTASVPFAEKTCYGQALPGENIQLPLSDRISETPVELGRDASMVVIYADGEPSPSVNENSLVVRLDLGATRLLLMGDAEAGGRKQPSQPPAASSIEGQILACCRADVAARILIAGHHGSMTSSRIAFLDAVGASVSVISAGPTKYGSVTLPDAAVVQQLTSRGQVFRTDNDDAACALSPSKVGPKADGKPGGCDNIQFVISDTSALRVSVWHGSGQ